MKYFTVAWPDSGTRIWMFLYDVSTQELFYERKVLDRVCLRNIQNFKVTLKYFSVAWPDTGIRFWIIVACVDKWKFLNQRKLLDRVFLRKCSRCHHFSKIFQCVINKERNTNLYFSSKAIFKTILRMEKIG